MFTFNYPYFDWFGVFIKCIVLYQSYLIGLWPKKTCLQPLIEDCFLFLQHCLHIYYQY